MNDEHTHDAEQDEDDAVYQERLVAKVAEWTRAKYTDVYAAHDSRLLPISRAVMFYLVAKPPRWRFMMADVVREFDIGREMWRKVRDNLIACGYLEGKNVRSRNGQMRWQWRWRSRPVEARVEADVGETDTGSTVGR